MHKQNSENEILVSRISDLYYKSIERNCPSFTSFLNEQEISVCLSALKDFGMTDYSFFGGYNNSQRKVLGFSAIEDEFPISIIEFRYRKQDTLNHRQFLGTLLSTGLKRSVIGDIICKEGITYVFAISNQAEYIISQVTRVARVGVKSKLIKLNDFTYTPEFKFYNYSVASLRLDAVVSAITGLSRDKTRTLILSKSVLVNHLEVDNLSARLNISDTISIRKYGRYVLEEVGGLTKKGRQKIIIKQYI